MRKRVLLAVAGCFITFNVYATQCPQDVDPYEVVNMAFDRSEFVFVGELIQERPILSSIREVDVHLKWKGPEVATISVDFYWLGGQTSNIFFLARDEAKPVWVSSFPTCFPIYSTVTIEEILNATAGKPSPPSDKALGMAWATFISVMVLACFGLALWQSQFLSQFPAWPLRRQ